MKLELFEFVDDTLKILDENENMLNQATTELEEFFTNEFEEYDSFLNLHCRVKSRESLREKILRNNLYLEHKEPVDVLKTLPDVIGIRIECRFIEDEIKLYNGILKTFNMHVEEDYYCSEINPNVQLKLDSKQPKIQKNGFEIYKIDSRYKKDDKFINFELQIKSLVNVFWSEIDHRILYKNYNYVLTEDFYRDIMASIKDNLSMIDRQLMVVFNHLNDLNSNAVSNEKDQIKPMLSKIIHDVYIGKVKEQLGFVIGFKNSTDIIVNYIFMKDRNESTEKYSLNFVRVLNRLVEISHTSIDFDEHIRFEREIFYSDDFTEKIGNAFLDVINKDFRWNLFFRIIFEIEDGNNAEDFEGFLVHFRYMFRDNICMTLQNNNMDDDEKCMVVNSILDAIANNFIRKMDIEFINEENVKDMNRYVRILLSGINNYAIWKDKEDYIIEKIEQFR